MSNVLHPDRRDRDLLNIFSAGLAAVRGGPCVQRYFEAHPLQEEVWVVAIGKAASSMFEGAFARFGARLRGGLVITRPGYAGNALFDLARVRLMEAGHPLPDQYSLAAGEALLQFIAATPPAARLVFLISGGASSVVEVLPNDVSLEDLRRANAWLLASGLDIHAMNAVRRRLSCIKGGRLADYLQGRTAICLMISDVSGDEPSAIGSGLLVAEPPDTAVPAVPAWLASLMALAPPLPEAAAACFAAVEVQVIATLSQALAAAAQCAGQLGYAVVMHEERLRGDAAAAGRHCAQAILQGNPGIHIWGGETTVVLPDQPGRGGRNQTLALAAAMQLAGHHHVALLAMATDGSDGPGQDAGALVDGGTIARGELEDLNAEACLRRADAGTFLEASGDLVSSGPTGTNVMDVVIGLKV